MHPDTENNVNNANNAHNTNNLVDLDNLTTDELEAINTNNSLDLDNLTTDELKAINTLNLSQQSSLENIEKGRHVADGSATILNTKRPISPTKKVGISIRTLATQRKEANERVTPKDASPLLEPSHLALQSSTSLHLVPQSSNSPHLALQSSPLESQHPNHLASPFPEVYANQGHSVPAGASSIPVGPHYIYKQPHRPYFQSLGSTAGPAHIPMFSVPAVTSLDTSYSTGAPSVSSSSFQPPATSTPVHVQAPHFQESRATTAIPHVSSAMFLAMATSVQGPPGPLTSAPPPTTSMPVQAMIATPHISSTTFLTMATSVQSNPAPAPTDTILLVPTLASAPLLPTATATISSNPASPPPPSTSADSEPDDAVNSGPLPGGRFTQAQQNALEEAFSMMNNAIHGFTRKGNLWNMFKSSMKNSQVKELVLGKLDGDLKWDGKSHPSKAQMSQAYIIFKQIHNDNQNGSNNDDGLFKEILETATALAAPVGIQTHQACRCTFDKASRDLERFGDRMHDCYGVTVVARMTGQSVDDDRSLTFLYDRDKFVESCCHGEQSFLIKLKTHTYNKVAIGMSIEEIQEECRRLGLSIPQFPTTPGAPAPVNLTTLAMSPKPTASDKKKIKREDKTSDLTSLDPNDLGDLNNFELVHLACIKIVAILNNGGLSVPNLPWKGMHDKLATHGYRFQNWPPDIPLPWAHDSHKGVDCLTKAELESLLKQCYPGESQLELIKDDHILLSNSEVPLFTTAPDKRRNVHKYYLCDAPQRKGKTKAGGINEDCKGKKAQRGSSAAPPTRRTRSSSNKRSKGQVRFAVDAEDKDVIEDENDEDELESELSMLGSDKENEAVATLAPSRSANTPPACGVPILTFASVSKARELAPAQCTAPAPTISLSDFRDGDFKSHNQFSTELASASGSDTPKGPGVVDLKHDLTSSSFGDGTVAPQRPKCLRQDDGGESIQVKPTAEHSALQTSSTPIVQQHSPHPQHALPPTNPAMVQPTTPSTIPTAPSSPLPATTIPAITSPFPPSMAPCAPEGVHAQLHMYSTASAPPPATAIATHTGQPSHPHAAPAFTLPSNVQIPAGITQEQLNGLLQLLAVHAYQQPVQGFYQSPPKGTYHPPHGIYHHPVQTQYSQQAGGYWQVGQQRNGQPHGPPGAPGHSQ
ncbi:hypothetical protein L218DRAFT_1005020 [Marasmius fiardii PR-910]|nr:hypothetical protein L218DRAFT_1005020 [Marasmius fiardii PR-910]